MGGTQRFDWMFRDGFKSKKNVAEEEGVMARRERGRKGGRERGRE